MWLLFALLAPLLFAVVHVMDSYCVDEVFEKPWMGMIISGITSFIVLLSFPFISPLFADWNIPLTVLGIAILAGVIIQINQALYFEALNSSDAPVVSAYWNLVPALTPLASIFITGEMLNFFQYLGIGVIVLSSFFLSIIDKRVNINSNAFLLILIASCLQIIAIFLLNYVFDSVNYYFGFISFNLGLMLAGFFPLLFEDAKSIFFTNHKTLNRHLTFLLGIEVVNLAAYGTLQAALSFGNPVLVTTLEASTPAYVFLVSVILISLGFIKTRKKIFEHIAKKIAFVFLMISGIILLNF